MTIDIQWYQDVVTIRLPQPKPPLDNKVWLSSDDAALLRESAPDKVEEPASIWLFFGGGQPRKVQSYVVHAGGDVEMTIGIPTV